MRPVIAYDVVRVCLAGVLLLAAGLKGYQLATEPILGTGLLDSRWFLIAVVEFELLFGLWLLGSIWASRTRHVAVLCFTVFAAVSLYKALSGAASCGCFGRVVVNPWYTFAMDVAAVLALFWWRPSGAAASMGSLRGTSVLRIAAVVVAWLLIGLPAAVIMGTYRYSMSAGEGVILAHNELVILKPEEWTSKRFPLLRYVEGRTTLPQAGYGRCAKEPCKAKRLRQPVTEAADCGSHFGKRGRKFSGRVRLAVEGVACGEATMLELERRGELQGISLSQWQKKVVRPGIVRRPGDGLATLR